MKGLITVNVTGKPRVVTQPSGKRYIVAPLTAIVPGVLPGSQGPLYYPPSEIQNSLPSWENTPLTLRHPSDPLTNEFLSAAQEGVLRRQGMGLLKNVKWEHGKFRGEGWFSEDRIKKLSPETYNKLLRGEPIELSTGLHIGRYEHAPGVHNGREYEYVVRDYKPDHLAILPDQRGACSVSDGCGVNNALGVAPSVRGPRPVGPSAAAAMRTDVTGRAPEDTTPTAAPKMPKPAKPPKAAKAREAPKVSAPAPTPTAPPAVNDDDDEDGEDGVDNTLVSNPFQSEAQRRFMWAEHPDIAHAWAHGEHTSDKDHKMPDEDGPDVARSKANKGKEGRVRNSLLTRFMNWILPEIPSSMVKSPLGNSSLEGEDTMTNNTWSDAAREAALAARKKAMDATVDAKAASHATGDATSKKLARSAESFAEGAYAHGSITKYSTPYAVQFAAAAASGNHKQAIIDHDKAAARHEKLGHTEAAEAHREASKAHAAAAQAYEKGQGSVGNSEPAIPPTQGRHNLTGQYQGKADTSAKKGWETHGEGLEAEEYDDDTLHDSDPNAPAELRGKQTTHDGRQKSRITPTPDDDDGDIDMMGDMSKQDHNQAGGGLKKDDDNADYDYLALRGVPAGGVGPKVTVKNSQGDTIALIDNAGFESDEQRRAFFGHLGASGGKGGGKSPKDLTKAAKEATFKAGEATGKTDGVWKNKFVGLVIPDRRAGSSQVKQHIALAKEHEHTAKLHDKEEGASSRAAADSHRKAAELHRTAAKAHGYTGNSLVCNQFLTLNSTPELPPGKPEAIDGTEYLPEEDERTVHSSQKPAIKEPKQDPKPEKLKKIAQTPSPVGNAQGKRCPDCGAELEPGMRTCPECDEIVDNGLTTNTARRAGEMTRNELKRLIANCTCQQTKRVLNGILSGNTASSQGSGSDSDQAGGEDNENYESEESADDYESKDEFTKKVGKVGQKKLAVDDKGQADGGNPTVGNRRSMEDFLANHGSQEDRDTWALAQRYARLQREEIISKLTANLRGDAKAHAAEVYRQMPPAILRKLGDALPKGQHLGIANSEFGALFVGQAGGPASTLSAPLDNVDHQADVKDMAPPTLNFEDALPKGWENKRIG